MKKIVFCYIYVIYISVYNLLCKTSQIQAQMSLKPAPEYVIMLTETEKLCEISFFFPAVRQTSVSPCPSSAQTVQKRQRDPFPQR